MSKMQKQRARVAERLAYLDRTGRYPLDRLTNVALSVDMSRCYAARFAAHVSRVELALAPVQLRRAA